MTSAIYFIKSIYSNRKIFEQAEEPSLNTQHTDKLLKNIRWKFEKVSITDVPVVF